MMGGTGQQPAPVVLAAYGSRSPAALESYDALARAVESRFSGREMVWAFTGRIIRQAMERQGRRALDPGRALEKLADRGHTRAVIMSLHLLPGSEFKTLEAAASHGHGLDRVAVSAPLLEGPVDRDRLATALLSALPEDRRSGEAVVMVGHGTADPAHRTYLELDAALRRLDPGVGVAVLEGDPGPLEVLSGLERSAGSRLWLMPLLVSAGVHSGRDVIGPGPDSCLTGLLAAGENVRPLAVPLADLPMVRDIWLDHLAQALAGLEREPGS